jgi:hypothetical protein
MSLIQHTDFTPVDASKRQISPNGPLSTRARSGRVADLTDIRGRTDKRDAADKPLLRLSRPMICAPLKQEIGVAIRRGGYVVVFLWFLQHQQQQVLGRL